MAMAAAASAAAGCCRRLNGENRAWGRELLAAVDTFLLDCDGVLWDGARALAGGPELLSRLQALGKRVYLISNNGSSSAGGLLDKCRRLGLPVGPRQLYNTSRCSALYLRQALAPAPPETPRGPVYVLGSPGLCAELREAGLRVLGGGQQREEEQEEDPQGEPSPPGIQAVLVGFDEHFSFSHLARACIYLRDPRCLFLATDPDPWYPREGGRVVPGTGSLTAAVEVASCRKAKVIGKPNRYMFDCIANEGEGAIDPSRALMIGDRLETDILFGANCGMRTVLVLTGVSTLQDAQANMVSDIPHHRKMVPDFYVDSIADFLPLLKD
ncbi:pyridoxal phosphate phosphatase-like [Carcharodon carcharias]|uniref:pyridoxal phosphate phosphatase-like n=1 Tax=Carcharodon carcharias TaxID=13397 RepID=UPI001B7E0BD5|nr:pyridoxal phosphate phosphatase-like [Carcharodon carcharias]